MDEVVLEAFRHHAWSNQALITASTALSREQLTRPGTATGTDRGILSILNHIVISDRGYVSRRGDRPRWAEDGEETDDLRELERRARGNAGAWERYVSDGLEARRRIILDDGAYEAEISVLVVQALHHGNVHREQISSILTSLGVEPPDIQAWAYAEATGHARERTGREMNDPGHGD